MMLLRYFPPDGKPLFRLAAPLTVSWPGYVKAVVCVRMEIEAANTAKVVAGRNRNLEDVNFEG